MGFKLEEFFGQPLDFFAREGARILLEVALEQEVSEFLERVIHLRREPIVVSWAEMLEAA